jgi:hypothetical protein
VAPVCCDPCHAVLRTLQATYLCPIFSHVCLSAAAAAAAAAAAQPWLTSCGVLPAPPPQHWHQAVPWPLPHTQQPHGARSAQCAHSPAAAIQTNSGRSKQRHADTSMLHPMCLPINSPCTNLHAPTLLLYHVSVMYARALHPAHPHVWVVPFRVEHQDRLASGHTCVLCCLCACNKNKGTVTDWLSHRHQSRRHWLSEPAPPC